MSGAGAKEFNMIAWTPVDHDPVPPIVASFFKRAPTVFRWRCQARSVRTVTPGGRDYIPLGGRHDGVQADVRGVDRGPQVTGRQFLNLPDGAFVVGMVGMNKDPNDRKNFVRSACRRSPSSTRRTRTPSCTFTRQATGCRPGYRPAGDREGVRHPGPRRCRTRTSTPTRSGPPPTCKHSCTRRSTCFWHRRPVKGSASRSSKRKRAVSR
jgi:hypothetical protein